MIHTELLSAAYDIGDKIGHIGAYTLLGLMLIVWLWVMFKYLDSHDLND